MQLVAEGLLLDWSVTVDKAPYQQPVPRDLFHAPDLIDHGLRDVTIRLTGVPLAADAALEAALAAFFGALADPGT
jgi:hypothetical protein